MRVGLNATCFNDRPSGANQRFLGLYGALIRQNPTIEFVVYEPSDQRIAAWFGDAANVSARVTPIPSVGRLARVRAGFNYWRQRLREDRLDMFEAFHLPLVRAPDCPTIMTIHDLRPLLDDTPILTRAMSSLVLHDAFARADHVIAVSDAVADEIRVFHPAARVSTVYNGVDPTSFAMPSAQAVAAVRARYALPESYLLAVGHLEARKNLPLLIDAVALLRAQGTPRPLVIVGNDGGARGAIRNQIAEHGLTDLVTVIEHADDAAVRALYAGCEMLVFPSRYEGFGIPILEAMATDKPMVLADTAVFRELTSGQGVYFPVDDAQAAADAIERTWHAPTERARQCAFGRARLHDFTFDRLAGQVATLYGALG
jgi:glycosyltransferase involved in cell wall biosynthesis